MYNWKKKMKVVLLEEEMVYKTTLFVVHLCTSHKYTVQYCILKPTLRTLPVFNSLFYGSSRAILQISHKGIRH